MISSVRVLSLLTGQLLTLSFPPGTPFLLPPDAQTRLILQEPAAMSHWSSFTNSLCPLPPPSPWEAPGSIVS